MKEIVMMLLFIGIIMIMHGIYQQKIQEAKNNVKIQYRFIPRTYYEEQLASTNTVTSTFKNMFTTESPWFDRNITKA
jgi:hypothetical protein